MRQSAVKLVIQVTAAALITGAAIAGCKSNNPSSTPPSSRAASAIAAVPGADKAAAVAILKQCVPVSAGGAVQLRWATAMLNDTKAHPNGSRHRLWDCAGIPQPERQAAQAALITDIEHVHWTEKASWQAFDDATLPQWIITFRGLQ